MKQEPISNHFDRNSVNRLIQATCPSLFEQRELDSESLNIHLPFDALIRRLLDATELTSKAFSDLFEKILGIPLVAFSPSDYKVQLTSTSKSNDGVPLVHIYRHSDPCQYWLSSTPWNFNMHSFIPQQKDERYRVAYALPETIESYVNFLEDQYTSVSDIGLVIEELSLNTENSEKKVESISDDAPAIVRFVDQLINQAQYCNASDIHIIPQSSSTSAIKLRIDGECEQFLEFPSSIHNAVIARIKILAGLDIAEKRLPQDGKLTHHRLSNKLEIRVATLPTVAGESAVLRLISQSLDLQLADLQMVDADRIRINQLLKKSHGLLLVVGPTGSGKTTTLHALLAELNDQSKSIWTIEDPVEITQKGMNQVQTNTKIDLSFAKALRAFLRADPDIILVGEMRDKETAHIAHEAALTGHLVLSTLHTNSACETVSRLRDLGVENMQIADTCKGILAQRLIRRLCIECKLPYSLTGDDKNTLTSLTKGIALAPSIQLYQPIGCDACRNTGYQGRIPIFELLIVNATTKELIRKGTSTQHLLDHARQNGLTTLSEDALRHLLAGRIDFNQFISLREGLEIAY